ncbi:hypothetical protein [Streptomyces aidingensis]|uniref:Uncharacterized protein n=1 Tax=Streptomyces aidingensis TaxID=910347 RepID=A0A1I1GYU3_9ACTN|nr:hypothetical protein [Streptomyces aidingensis]SFC16685.1 hypothetical protein SAMN05421773_102180 [Streptomyces aidingensis]
MRDSHHETIRKAVSLAAGKAGDEDATAERLRLLGKAADMLARMASGHQHVVSQGAVSC